MQGAGNAVYNTPRDARVPHFVFLDELPVFLSPADLITRALTQVCKFKIRVISAFQGTQLFPDRSDDRLLNTLIGQCNLQFYFRHKNPADAKFFGEVVKLPSYDRLKKKHVLTTPQQYQDGNNRFVLTDESANWNDAEQEGASQADAVAVVKSRLAIDDACLKAGLLEPMWIMEQDRDPTATDRPLLQHRHLYHAFAGAQKTITCQPDAACVLRIPRNPLQPRANTSDLLVYWERDRSTESRAQILEKIAFCVQHSPITGEYVRSKSDHFAASLLCRPSPCSSAHS